MMVVEDLNRQFGLSGEIRFTTAPGGLPVVLVSNRFAHASIALQGAHVMTFQPAGEEPLIWLSDHTRFGPGKSIRGGVPICWPWFGPHESDPTLPGHGYARTAGWRLTQVQSLPLGTRLTFELEQTTRTRAQWPYNVSVRNVVTVGRELQVDLITTNLGIEPVVVGDALHTYLRVGDVRRIGIYGLDSCEYVDKVDDGARKQQQGAVSFSGEVDRVYLDTGHSCEIRDPVMGRRIVVSGAGSASTVVWNPWEEKAKRMGDLGPDGYLEMVCVETANALDDVRTLEPLAQHRLSANYRIESF